MIGKLKYFLFQPHKALFKYLLKFKEAKNERKINNAATKNKSDEQAV